MKRGIRFSSVAWEHYRFWMEQDKVTWRRIHALITDCLRDPYNGIGKPEPLKHEFSGALTRNTTWSTACAMTRWRWRRCVTTMVSEAHCHG